MREMRVFFVGKTSAEILMQNRDFAHNLGNMENLSGFFWQTEQIADGAGGANVICFGKMRGVQTMKGARKREGD